MFAYANIVVYTDGRDFRKDGTSCVSFIGRFAEIPIFEIIRGKFRDIQLFK